jgi:2-hydroxy-6-oxonona-2,4-dienedioate hydrolase
MAVRTRTLWSEVDGSRMHAVVLGAGPPVVLVHGYGVSGNYMRPLARTLAPSFSAFIPDLPGQGKSARLEGQTTIAALADAVGGWIDVHELIRPAVVANSMGCQIVTDLAARRPDAVGSMVLIGPTVDPARRRAPHQLLDALRDSSREPFALLLRAARDDAGVGIRMLLSTGRAVLADRIEERLPSIEQPTVVVYGENDGFVGPDWAERVAALLPRGRLVFVEDEPHAVHYTRPDLIATIVAELVEEEEHVRGELAGRLEHRDVPAA